MSPDWGATGRQIRREVFGIRPTGRIAMLRYCTFHRVVDNTIHETVMVDVKFWRSGENGNEQVRKERNG